jgi:hypothetical protein
MEESRETIGTGRIAVSASRPLAVVLLLSAWLCPWASSAQTIEGVLLERGTDQRVDLGLVTLLSLQGDSIHSVLSDSIGRFRVSSPEAGEFLLAASGLGYESTVAESVFALAEGARLTLEFRIEAVPIQIGGLTVEAQASLLSIPRLVRNGFVERVQKGFGLFITPGDVEEARGLDLIELLAGTGRVTTRYDVGGDQVLMRGPVGYCTPTIYLDGVPQGTSRIDAIVQIASLEAAEIYRSAAEAPSMYGSGMGGCGIILLWTRTR